MKKQKTRLTSLLLSILMVLGMFSVFPSVPISVNAETREDGLSYELSAYAEPNRDYSGLVIGFKNQVLTGEITGYSNNTETALIIPDTINGGAMCPIVFLGDILLLGDFEITTINGTFNSTSLETVSIPNSVTSINSNAFDNCNITIICGQVHMPKRSPKQMIFLMPILKKHLLYPKHLLCPKHLPCQFKS